MPLPAQIIHICTVADLPDHDNTTVHIGGSSVSYSLTFCH
jgi:hypothetical protein